MSVRSRALNWAKHNKLRGGRSWEGWCQSLAFRLCEFMGEAPNPPMPNAALAAKKAFEHSKSRWPGQAPAGAFHYWSVPGTTDGHVGLDLSGKGTEVLMASKKVTKLYGLALGTTSVTAYNKAANATYLGWSYFNGSNGYVALPKPKRR